MGVKFDLFRMTLLDRVDPELFAPVEAREEYLRRVFSTSLDFTHHGKPFWYRPAHIVADEAVFGRLGRRVVLDENLPPEEGLGETTHESWRACVIAVDPRNHPDGQKLAIERDRTVGGPVALANALAKAINVMHANANFSIEISPIFDARTFWEFAKNHHGDIISLTFDLVVPNGLWTADKNIRDEMAEVRDELNGQEVVTTIKAPYGINTDSPRVADAVAYAESGSGSIAAKTRNGESYYSKNVPKSVTIDDVEKDRTRLIERVATKLLQVFGRG